MKNPAVIGTPSDWVFGSYLFTNMNKLTPGDDKGPTAFAIGVDYRIAPQIGSFGLIYTKEKISAEVVSLLEMIYAHSVPFKNGFINAGLSGGINKYEFDLSNYQNPYAEFDPLFVDGTKFQHLKMGVGLFYNSSKLDLGISAIRFFELDKNEESNP